MRYFLVVGEASADLHASRLIRALREQDAEAEFAFMGGDLMAEASGVTPVVHYRDVAFMGILPVLRNLGTIKRKAKLVQEHLLSFSPDVVIPVDFAGFNFEYILPFVKHHYPTCPIVYYIAPKLWAWKPWRIKTLRRYVDELLVILPFEEAYFTERGVPTSYVGNPSAEAIAPFRAEGEERKAQIALLAGSRKQELKANLPIMLESVRPYKASYRVVIAGAPGLSQADYQPYLEEGVELRFAETFEILRESYAALVTSGTATLETALLGTPEVVCYRMGGSRLARWIFDSFFSVPYISLVNLILERNAVPELIGHEVTAGRIASLLSPLLQADSLERRAQCEAMQALWQRLGEQPASQRVAQQILKRLNYAKH